MTASPGRTLVGTNKGGIYAESSTQLYPLGDKLPFDDGRVFRYAKNGAVALAAGKLCQAAAPVANHTDQTVAATLAAGVSKTITLDIGGTAITAGQYENGWLIINDATGEGQIYKIKSHPTSAGTAEVIFTLWDAVNQAVTVDVSEASLYPNVFSGLVVAPTTLTSVVVGVPLIDVTIAYYFWVQTAGMANVLIDQTPGAGVTVVASDNVAGAVEPITTGAVTLPVVGHMVGAGVDTEYRYVMLKLDA